VFKPYLLLVFYYLYVFLVFITIYDRIVAKFFRIAKGFIDKGINRLNKQAKKIR